MTYTFRTTFELVDVLPESAVLQGGFISDRRVTGIRLNGRVMPVPEQGESAPFDRFHAFTVNRGFVAGTNALEFDVYNSPSAPSTRKGQSGRRWRCGWSCGATGFAMGKPQPRPPIMRGGKRQKGGQAMNVP